MLYLPRLLFTGRINSCFGNTAFNIPQLCEMHIEHCSVLTATGFESTFAITAPLCLCLLFLFYLLALLLRLEMDFWATTMLPKNVDPPGHGILSCWEIGYQQRIQVTISRGLWYFVTHQSCLDLQQFFVF